jgi:diguanylate cyclase (GGDEF)-like protein/PAS domain S-box-containing protein
MNTPETGYQSVRGDTRIAAFVAVLLAVALLIASATGYILWQSRIETYRRADAACETLVRAIAKDLERSIEAHNVALGWAINGLSTPGFAEASDAVRRQMLFGSDLNAQTLGGILIVDDTGRALFESGSPVPRIANVSDAPYFKALRDHSELGLVVSRPFRAVTADGLSIALARRIIGADGQFAGVAVSMIKLSFLHELLHTAAAGADDAITLVAEDGTLIAREPRDDQLIGRDLSALSTWDSFHAVPDVGFDLVSGITHVYRHYRVMRVGKFPLLLLNATALSAVFAGWWQETLAIGAVTAATIVLLLGLARSLHLELARRRHAEMIARGSAEQFRMLAENVGDIIVRLGLDGVGRYVSPSVEEVLGFTVVEMREGARWDSLIHPDDRPLISRALEAMRAGKEHVTVLYRCFTKAGTEAWLEARLRLVRDAETGEPREIIALARDVTSRHASEQELRRLASTDGLTGLANRRRFDEALDSEWRRAMRAGELVALLMLDADYFKLYNDRYGHPAGDEALRMIAGCIRGNVGRPGDLAARYGGEEFAVLLPATDTANALAIAERIRIAIHNHTVPHGDSPFRCLTVSIGVACSLVKEGRDPRLLVQHADIALYEAKRSGRDRVVAAEVAMTVAAS